MMGKSSLLKESIDRPESKDSKGMYKEKENKRDYNVDSNNPFIEQRDL